MLKQALLARMARGKLSAFLFHKIPLERDLLAPAELHLAAFEAVIDFIRANFSVLPLEDAVARLPSGRLPPRAACITFDDGYENWSEGAIPVLERHGLHATFFICSGQYTGLPMWHERILHAVWHLRCPELTLPDSGLPTLPVATLAQRQAALDLLEHHLKYQTLTFREEILARLEAIAGVDPIALPRMSVAQLRTLANKGFGIGAHTVNHPILGFCDSDSAMYEIGTVREHLEGIIGQPVKGFAYPNGRPLVDFTAQTVRMVKQVGYGYAVTTDWGVANAQTSIFQIPRFTPWGPAPFRMTLQVARNLMTRPVSLPE